MRSKKGGSLLIIIEILALILVVLFVMLKKTDLFFKDEAGANEDPVRQEELETSEAEESEATTEDGDSENAIGTGEKTDDEVTIYVQDTLAKMSLEQKVAQLFFVTPEELTGANAVTSVGDLTKSALEETPVGGLVFSSGNFTDTEQTSQMLEDIESELTDNDCVPAFLAVAELGGDASPYADAVGIETAISETQLGQAGISSSAAQAGRKIGGYLSAAGFNTVFAPIVDRAFADVAFSFDGEVVADMTTESISGFHDAGMLTAAASFPASGTDEPNGYTAAADAETDFMILSNEKVEGISDDLPATLNEDVVDYLRNDLSYDGIILSGNLTESTIKDNYKLSEIVVSMINNGVTMINQPSNLKTAKQAILDAVEDGSITEDTIDQAVSLILEYKYKLANQ